MKIKRQSFNEEMFDRMCYKIYTTYSTMSIQEEFGLDASKEMDDGYWRHIERLKNED
jgi:hypothetical protein